MSWLDNAFGALAWWRYLRGGHWEWSCGDVGAGPFYMRHVSANDCRCTTGRRMWPGLGGGCEGTR